MKRTFATRAIAPSAKRAKKGLAPPSPLVEEPSSSTAYRDSILKRMHKAVSDVVDASDDAVIIEALGADTSIDALIHLVGRPEVIAEAAAKSNDPLRQARARAVRRSIDLMKAEGGCIGVEEVAERLRIGRAAVDKRRKLGRLLAVDSGSRAVAYPSWQFSDLGVLAGLEDVLQAFTVADPLMRIEFFLSNDPDLGETPLKALEGRRVADVVAAAARYGCFGDDG